MDKKNRNCNDGRKNQNNLSKNNTNSSLSRQQARPSNSKNFNQQELRKNKRNSLKRNLDDNSENGKEENETKKDFNFGFKRLEELCSKDTTEIIFVMSDKTNGFIDLFKQNKEPDWIFLLMRISSKICSTEFNQSKTSLLSKLICNTFLEHLKLYILSTPTEKIRNRCDNMNVFFEDCLVVFQSITTLFPKTSVERLKEIVLSANIALTGIKNYCNSIKIKDTTLVEMNELLQKLNEITLTDELQLEEKQTYDNIAQFLPPPDNFRELTVYPTTADLECGEPFLRPNITKGAYQDVEHYLDVQFRLLREDFIAPLREGIKLYKERLTDQQQNTRRKKINNIRVYRDVEFEEKGEFVHDKYGFIINFDKNKRLKINWEMAKRFMYGSVLLFTANEFNTFFFGIVLERKIELLKNGKLIVELLEDAKPTFNSSLTMVESEVYFEPYKCSMEVLKKINNHNFPMEKYIISACNEIDYPYYINTFGQQNYVIDKLHNFNLLNSHSWPTKEQLGLDEMQYRAFTAALTHEFTVIQGPPGTGKTFIGLKIMKTIINNLYTKAFLTKPVIIVCYTNHALDQFMEGILSFTNKVVRIGGQSKSEVINNYNLKSITKFYRRSNITNRGLHNVSNRVSNIMHEIKYFKKCSEVLSSNAGVLELSLLKNGMPKHYHNFFKTTLDLLSWLFQDFDQFSVDPIIFINALGHDLINKVYHFEQLLEVKHEIEEEEEDLGYEADDPDLEFNHGDVIIYSLTLDDVRNACKELLLESIKLEELEHLNEKSYNDSQEAKFNFDIMEKIHDYFIEMLSLVDVEVHIPQLSKYIRNLNMLNMRQRWALYFHWVKTTKEMFAPKILKYEQMYAYYYKQYAELRELENIEILNKVHVVALTTTGAAKHRIMLEGLQSPIVVVEEAAEVLEAHIISSLTRYCQHLILIGDHKQLRPSNAVYKLAKDFNFDISLFERMVNNNVPCYTLGEQHRMRPEIASLISPHIYSNLNNHISVFNRDHVRGVTKDMFFLNHKFSEKEVDEISSKSNDHEVSFLIMFARHLLLQGYKPDQVTILTTYSGQMFQFRSLRKNHPILEKVKITVVDNYQGEESDIILLSLVRSNKNGNVGFLKTENRICVALSRAKYGFYIMGNMDNLYNSGNLWKKIKETLVNQNSYGDELVLECTIHSGMTTKVSKGEDFNVIIEGGCTILCKSLMSCGHYCASVCHVYDREHIKMKCREPCNRSCNYNHPCMKKCFEDCGKCIELTLKKFPCGHQVKLPCFVDSVTFPCEELVETMLNDCGYKITKKCFEENPLCTYKCFDRLDCGHACERNCHKNDDADHEKYKCMKPCENINVNCSLNHKCLKLCHEDCSFCTVKIDKTLNCGHLKKNVPCGYKDEDIQCYSPCERVLICNHKCQAKCHETCKPCEQKVKKIIPNCGHSVTLECKTDPKREHCEDNCERTLECGHKCKNLCASPCFTKDCKEIVLKKLSRLACGHGKVWVFCCDTDKEFRMDSQYLLDKCKEPCHQKLNCGDVCLGTCGQCKQGRLHVPCNEKCQKINPCNHTCKFPCKERCPPCNQKCLYSCVHSRCTRICGKPCATCQENCSWKCPHLSCSKKCGEICDREPCYGPCELKLQCEHECIGFCSEPCPPLCRICHKDEVTSIVFGNEDEPDARFVYLEDCKHTVESGALEQWMNQNDEEIALKQCPLCKTPILKTQRFMNYVKVILKDITIIKRKRYGELSVIRSNTSRIVNVLNSLNTDFHLKFIGDINKFEHIKDLWNIFCQPLLASLNYEGKALTSFSLPAKDIESLDYIIDLFKSISKYKERINNISDFQQRETVINHFVWLLSVAFTYPQKLSNQQKYDINLEMARGARLVCLFEIMSNDEYKVKIGLQTSDAMELKNLVGNMEALLMSCKAYTLHRDEEIQNLTDAIKEKIKGIVVLSDEEKRMIHAAMAVSFHGGLRSQGHWCKCKNGHIYCVTECGGPMQKAVCPECKVAIGGGGHRYVEGTTVATEMDGSRYLAWSSGANMDNYLLDDLH